jgi:hypothetical protein
MTQDQVRDRMERVLGLMRDEQALRSEIMTLDFSPGSRKQAQATLKRQAALLDKIRLLRQQQVLPIVRELVEFIAAKSQGVEGARRAA